MYRQKLQTFIMFCLFCVGFYSCASPHLEQDFKEKFQTNKVKLPKLKTQVNFIDLSQENISDLNCYIKLFKETCMGNNNDDSSTYGYAIWRFKSTKFYSTEYEALIYYFYLPMLVGVPSSKTNCMLDVEFEIQNSKREVLFLHKFTVDTLAYKAILYGYTYNNTIRESFIRSLLAANSLILENIEPSIPKLESSLIKSGSILY